MERIRHAALPPARSVRSTFAAVLLVITVAFGLLATHGAIGGHHAGHGPVQSTAASADPAGDHADRGSDVDGDPHSLHDGARSVAAGGTAITAGSEDAGSTAPTCSIADPACAMTAASPVTTGIATAPDAHPRSTAVVFDELRGIRLGFVAQPPPDLHLLSISRT